MNMNQCSYVIQYWNHDSLQYLIFECTNEKLPESEFCIFHDPHFLDNENTCSLVKKEFDAKIAEYLSNSTKSPLLCIGYRLADVSIQGKEFQNSVYFDGSYIKGSVSINSKFQERVSFAVVEFFGKGDVQFANAKFSGGISFLTATFSNEGGISFSDTLFSGKGGVYFNSSKFSNKGNENMVSFAKAKFSNKGELIFHNTQFSNKGYVLFGDTTFSSEKFVSFGGTRFSGTTFFQ